MRLGLMDQRTFEDRRKQPTPVLSRYTLFGRRTSFRRDEDRRKGGYVDRYGLKLLCCLLLLAVMNVLDVFFTLTILHNGGREINPLFHWALSYFGNTAWRIKIAVVTIFSILLCLHSRFQLARVSIVILTVIYSGLIMYQVMLLRYIYM